MMDGKMVVLKPVAWNDKGYVWPAGIPATSGYSKNHGYGHEEWNGRSDWVWEGWKVFHTQAKGRMHRYDADGRLGIIMTTMRDKRFFAVGVGCNVFENSDSDNVEIAEALNLPGYAENLWKVESIQKAKRGRRADFDRHWRDHMHVNWRCPQTHYAWFGVPVPIEPNELIPSSPPRQAIVKMHGSYQAVRPDQALSIVRRALAPDHPVIAWLSTGDFDPVRNRNVQGAPSPKGGGRRSAAAATDPVVRYMQEYELVVSPLHHRLQEDFTAHLRKSGIRGSEANIECVDLRYRDPHRGGVLVEVKPTEPSTVRFAVRTAMGQLLDYRQRNGGAPAMLIVVDDEPSGEDSQLALSNGFGIAWRAPVGFSFAWPGER
ncbi:MAG: hypothetical protein QOJ27_419 [Sphingomonadales bacterium]|nr:hypothetical protein [Sphingomonadales bacterium]